MQKHPICDIGDIPFKRCVFWKDAGSILHSTPDTPEQDDSAYPENRDVSMKRNNVDTSAAAKAAILALAEIKAAAEAFERGESNVFDALDAVTVAVEAYRAGEPPRREAA